jgi:SNF2 family DNA or RNA helicase
MSDVVEKIRYIRNLSNPVLAPSPYFKDTFIDESGDEHPVELRNYQKADVMNMLMVERTLYGNDTGLGKTISVLSTLSYIWMKEPNYVPIVIVRKSALYQWRNEVTKFLHGMEAVIVEGQPFERNKLYHDFFLNHSGANKKLLVLTYEILLRDLQESVVKDKSEKADKFTRDKLKRVKELHKRVVSEFENKKAAFSIYFSDRPFDIREHVKDRLAIANQLTPDKITNPLSWNDDDEKTVTGILSFKNLVKESDDTIRVLEEQIAPPKVVPGIIDYVNESKKSCPNSKLMLVMDEVHTIKNHKGKIHAACNEVSLLSNRVIGMTATPVKNRLMEFYAIFRIIQPRLFPRVTSFMNEFCITKLQPIGGGRKVPIVVGYKNLDKFVSIIEPYYLARRKHEVAKELPQLITQELVCELTQDQEELYDLAELGLLNKSDEDSSAAEVLSSLVMVQQAANAPQLIADENGTPFEGESSKVATLLDLFQNELCDTKTIVFSRFEKMVSLVERELINANIKCVRITGKENKAKDRETAKSLFQDPNSGINIILITSAGSESINLQAAEHLIFIDLPWSGGDYLQIIGRMIRIGSQHKTVVSTALMAVRKSGKKTIDYHVLKTLKLKKKLMDKVSGDALPGGLEISDAVNIFKSIREDNSDRSFSVAKPSKVKMIKPAVEKFEVSRDIVDIDMSLI